jgi:hypothetical protein
VTLRHSPEDLNPQQHCCGKLDVANKYSTKEGVGFKKTEDDINLIYMK